jgi:bacterioferritin
MKLVEGADIMLEEFARGHISLEVQHIGQVDKMLRKPGDIAAFERAQAS